MVVVLRAPEPRRPLPVGVLPAVRGEAVVVGNEAGWHHGYVAWGEVYMREDHPYVDVVSTEDWWRHRLLGTAPSRVQPWPAAFVFVA